MALLGCIADDFTGGTDLANNLTKAGFRTVQTIGVPEDGAIPADADAVVVALKTRTCPAADAVRASLAALTWLRSLGCVQIYFKYCSTFDSTPQGNIGPVIDALLDALGDNFTIACPAFPDNGRTVYRGHLFVHDALLSESGMQNHPLTPMRDPNLLRVLGAQTPSKVGLVSCEVIDRGSPAVAVRLRQLSAEGVRVAIVDTTANAHLHTLAGAVGSLKLITGGSGLASGLGKNFGLAPLSGAPTHRPELNGPRAILAGSCSRKTLLQLENAKQRYPFYRLSAPELATNFDATVARAARWTADALKQSEPFIVYCSGTPEEIAENQRLLGVQRAGELCEQAMARIAITVVDGGVNRLILAGGETSGAVVKGLGVDRLRIGPEIDPGVPWTYADVQGREIALALKSGNFGSDNFLTAAWQKL